MGSVNLATLLPLVGLIGGFDQMSLNIFGSLRGSIGLEEAA